MSKKITTILLAVLLLLCLSACNEAPATSQTMPSSSENVSGESASSVTITTTQEQKNTTNTSSDSAPTTQTSKLTTTTHIHSYSEATCLEPQKCSCGITKGGTVGHNWIKATCKAPKTCSVCKITEGATEKHNFHNGKCTYCELDDVMEIDEELLKNTVYVGYEEIDDDHLKLHVLEYNESFAESTGFAMTTSEYYYRTFFEGNESIDKELETFGTDYLGGNKTLVYNQKNYYGGNGGTRGLCFVVKDNTLQVFDYGDLYTIQNPNAKVLATYVMRHDKTLRLVSANSSLFFPETYEISN